MAEVTKEIFIEEYQNFTGSDREFAEYLNKTYKPETPFNDKSVFSRRKRLKLKTVNPKIGGDKEGLRKFLKNFKGKEIYKGFVKETGDKFGVDRKTTGQIIKEIRPDIYELPRKETVEQKQKREIEERKAELKKKEKTRITEKQFKEEYKKFKPVKTGSDGEFAEYLNKNKKYTSYRGEPFTSRNINQFRKDFGVEAKLFTTRPKTFTDKDILKEVERMKLNIDPSKMNMDDVRRAVFSARNLETGRSPEDIKKLADFRQRKKLMASNKRIFPVTIGKDATPKDLFWRDLIDNAQRHQSYLKNRPGPILANSHIKFLNPNEGRPTDTKGFKKIKLVDTNVIGKQNKPMTLTYDNFLNHLDKNSKMYGIDSKTAMEEYKKKRFIQKNPDLRNKYNLKLNSRYDPTSATKRAVFSPFHIHHTAGRGQNGFNVQFAVGTENMAENAFRRTFDKEFKAANTLSDKKAAVKKYLDSVPENLEVRLKKTPYGTRETLVEMTQRVAPELSQMTNKAIKLYENADAAGKIKLENRIGCSRGCFIKTVKEEPQKLIEIFRGERANAPGKMMVGDEMVPYSEKLKGRFYTANKGMAERFADDPSKIKRLKIPEKDFNIGTKLARRINVDQMADQLILPRKTINEIASGSLKYNSDVGAFETPNGDVATQEDLKLYADENPMEVKVGTEPPTPNKSVLKTVGKTLAKIGTPLPTALIDGYFINKQMDEGKSTAEIAKDPLNWLGLATMEPLTKVAGANTSGGLNAVLRLGLNPATIRGISRFAGLPGLALSTAMTAYDQYKKYQNEEGFVYNLFNKEGN